MRHFFWAFRCLWWVMVYLTCGKLDLKAVTTSPSVRVFCKLARTRTSSQLV